MTSSAWGSVGPSSGAGRFARNWAGPGPNWRSRFSPHGVALARFLWAVEAATLKADDTGSPGFAVAVAIHRNAGQVGDPGNRDFETLRQVQSHGWNEPDDAGLRVIRDGTQ